MKKYIIPIILAVLIIVLIMKGTNNGTPEVNEVKQDLTSDVKETESEVKDIPKEDQLIEDCKDSFKECKSISIKKFGWSISLSETEKFDDKEGIEEFYNTWSIVFGLFGTQELELDYPIVLFAFSIKTGDNPPQLPGIAVCEEGELTESSKRRLGCG